MLVTRSVLIRESSGLWLGEIVPNGDAAVSWRSWADPTSEVYVAGELKIVNRSDRWGLPRWGCSWWAEDRWDPTVRSNPKGMFAIVKQWHHTFVQRCVECLQFCALQGGSGLLYWIEKFVLYWKREQACSICAWWPMMVILRDETTEWALIKLFAYA